MRHSQILHQPPQPKLWGHHHQAGVKAGLIQGGIQALPGFFHPLPLHIDTVPSDGATGGSLDIDGGDQLVLIDQLVFDHLCREHWNGKHPGGYTDQDLRQEPAGGRILYPEVLEGLGASWGCFYPEVTPPSQPGGSPGFFHTTWTVVPQWVTGKRNMTKASDVRRGSHPAWLLASRTLSGLYGAVTIPRGTTRTKYPSSRHCTVAAISWRGSITLNTLSRRREGILGCASGCPTGIPIIAGCDSVHIIVAASRLQASLPSLRSHTRHPAHWHLALLPCQLHSWGRQRGDTVWNVGWKSTLRLFPFVTASLHPIFPPYLPQLRGRRVQWTPPGWAGGESQDGAIQAGAAALGVPGLARTGVRA